MSGLTAGIIAFLLAIAASSLVWAGPAVPFAVIICLVLIGAAVFLDVKRRRDGTKDVQDFRNEAKTESVDFTARDKETLSSE